MNETEKRIEYLEQLIALLEQTINGLYSPKDKMWNKGLGLRDDLQKEVDKLEGSL